MLTRLGVRLGMWLMRCVFWVLRLLPERRSVRLARGISRVLAIPSMTVRRRAQDVLFAAQTKAGRQALERDHIDYLARMRVHGARLPLESRQSIHASVPLEGEEHLAAARARNRGVLIVSGHVGSWLHILPVLAGRDHPILFLVNPALPGLRSYAEAISTRHGFALANVGDDAHDAARSHFRSGGVLYVTIDATVRPERSIWLRFGESELLVDPGPAVLALRHRVPVIWASPLHDDTGRSCVRLGPPMDVGPGTSWTRAEPLMQHWLDLLWADVSTHRGQWWPIAYVPVRRPVVRAPGQEPALAASVR